MQHNGVLGARRLCCAAATAALVVREYLVVFGGRTYVQCNIALHNQECPMLALIERLLDAAFAPLARELERLPPEALRYRIFF